VGPRCHLCSGFSSSESLMGPASKDSTNEPAAAIRTASDFLSSIFNGQEHGFLVLFCKPGNISDLVDFEQDGWSKQAAVKALHLRERGNVYFAIGAQSVRPPKGRGKAAGVNSLPGLWSDIDVLGPNHASLALPPTIEGAWRILQALPFRPTIVVYTGGGMQAYWLFREPWKLDTEKEQKKAKALSRAFQEWLQRAAIQQGWTIDGTADLCRLLRLPGTYNRKQAQPVAVRYEIIKDGQRYNPSDFDEFLEIEADPDLKAHLEGPAPEKPRADFLRILAGCRWMRHCKNAATTLPEPEWYRMLSIVGRCKDGTRIAHEMSKPYAKYTALETNEKLKQSMGAAGPATCSFIGGDLGRADCCSQCNNRGKIKSPIVLGIPSRRWSKHDEQDGGPPALRNGLPNIQSTNRQLRDITRDCLNALRAFNRPPSIFVHAGKPVCVHKEENCRQIIIEATDRVIRNRLTLAADFYEIIKGGSRDCPPPMDAVQDLLAMPPLDWGFPQLQGIVEAPALREDGSIITVPGYDEQSRLFYAQQDDLHLPEIPEHPTADQMDVAVAIYMTLSWTSPL
jgi:hypothetical protein